MFRASARWTNTVAAMLTSPATREAGVRGKKTQETAAMLSRPLYPQIPGKRGEVGKIKLAKRLTIIHRLVLAGLKEHKGGERGECRAQGGHEEEEGGGEEDRQVDHDAGLQLLDSVHLAHRDHDPPAHLVPLQGDVGLTLHVTVTHILRGEHQRLESEEHTDSDQVEWQSHVGNIELAQEVTECSSKKCTGDGSNEYCQPHLCGPGEVVEDWEQDGDDCADEDAIEACDTGIEIRQWMEAEDEVSQCGGHPAEDATEADLNIVKKQTREDNSSQQRVVHKCWLKNKDFLR